MRKLSLALTLGLTLACAGAKDPEAFDSESGDQDFDLWEVDLICDNEGFEFTARAEGAESIDVTGWLLDSELGTFPLTFRGDGDWIGFVSNGEMGADCVRDVSDMYFLFVATDAQGREREQGY